jgi:hypothetical protein
MLDRLVARALTRSGILAGPVRHRLSRRLLAMSVLLPAMIAVVPAAEPVGYTVKLETVLTHDDGKWFWYHPRAAAVPGGVVMTIQKHLGTSDHYSGLHFLRRAGTGGAWSGPCLPAQIDWQPQPDGVTLGVADVTPGWHAPTRRLLAIGCQVRYDRTGRELDDVRRAHQTVYAVFDPESSEWTPWRLLELPEAEHFDFARNACSQWLVKTDGSLLVPLYIGTRRKEPRSTTVAACRFDGDRLVFESHGDILRLEQPRGLYEPSLIAFGGRFFLTMRNDVRGYVSVSDNGLHFAEPKPWLFDDGADLGSYNTQQHWLAHRDGLFLVYTRRGAGNDHVFRHRAPLFMARVDPVALRVIRSTETIIVPERGADLGNFGCAAIDADESWVTVSEGMSEEARSRGATGATWVARIQWSRPTAPAP